MVVARPETFQPSVVFGYILYLPYNKKPIKKLISCSVSCFGKQSERPNSALVDENLMPGGRCMAVVTTDRATVAAYGDSFVIRGYVFLRPWPGNDSSSCPPETPEDALRDSAY